MDLRRGSHPRRLIAIAILLGIFAFRWFTGDATGPGSAPPANVDLEAAAESAGTQAILGAFAQQQSGVWVETSGRVERHLADDNYGDRHQRFIVRIAPNHTVLVSHNIDLAKRTSVDEGEAISFRGRYEWNDRGGVVHWTHHNPKRGVDDFGRGGWLRTANEMVR